MNQIIFTGNLGEDAKVSQTQSGTSVCSFSVAAKSGYGEHEKTTWVRCKLWGKRAEGGLPPILVKGQRVLVRGEFTLDKYEKDGKTYSTLECRVDDLDLIGEKKAGGSPSEPRQQTAPEAEPSLEDEIPF